jgi:tRNA threonylcarbamoyladenosine biosynthesis protein TsaB
MGELYFAAFRFGPGAIETVVGPLLVTPESVPGLPEGAWIGCGNGFDRFGEQIALRLPLVSVRHDRHPEAKYVATIAAARYASGERHAAEALVPLYVRDKVALTTAER